MAKEITATQYETWDILAKKHLGYEYYAKDIMLANPQYADTVIFEGGEQIIIPDFADSEELTEDSWS